jgi:hypothetical protein
LETLVLAISQSYELNELEECTSGVGVITPSAKGGDDTFRKEHVSKKSRAMVYVGLEQHTSGPRIVDLPLPELPPPPLKQTR